MSNFIDDCAKNNFRIAIFPQKYDKKWFWTAGVYVGDCDKAEWINSNNDLPDSCYNTYEEALISVKNYINNYKPKKLRIRK